MAPSISIQCKKLVKPSNPTPSHLQNLKLSSIDQLQPPYYVSVNFHFDLINNRRDLETRQIISRLEQSLSEILTLYYPFAGRYDDGVSTAAVVLCLDQGVEFVAATVDENLDQLVGGDNLDILVSGLSRFPVSGMAQNPLILIQVNTFKCGGLVIGLCFYHKIADMFTMSKFMNDWAKTCRSGTLDNVVPPNFDISSLLPPKHNFVARTLPPPPPKGQVHPRFVMRRFVFSGESIKKLKTATSSNNNVCNYTRVELVTALISSAIINMDHIKFGRIRPFLISHTMSLRKRTELLAGKENSCGNLYTVVTAAKDIVNGCLELKELASLIHCSITSCTAEIAKLREGTELSINVENVVRAADKEIAKGEDVHGMLFSSWFRFPLYEVDFGWGRPSLVSLLPVPFIYVGFVDNKNDAGGIEAWVNLEEGDMAHFRCHQDILTYTS